MIMCRRMEALGTAGGLKSTLVPLAVGLISSYVVIIRQAGRRLVPVVQDDGVAASCHRPKRTMARDTVRAWYEDLSGKRGTHALIDMLVVGQSQLLKTVGTLGAPGEGGRLHNSAALATSDSFSFGTFH